MQHMPTYVYEFPCHVCCIIADEMSQSNTTHPHDDKVDPMQVIYQRCDLVCQLSCLALTLRAVPAAFDSLDGVTEECVAAARSALDTHQDCMTELRERREDRSQVTKYINW